MARTNSAWHGMVRNVPGPGKGMCRNKPNRLVTPRLRRALPGWALPYDILPGERLLPKW